MRSQRCMSSIWQPPTQPHLSMQVVAVAPTYWQVNLLHFHSDHHSANGCQAALKGGILVG